MDIIKAMENRRSIRGFKPDPVPKETIEKILAVSTRAPTPRNIQAWHIYVVTGETLDNLRWENLAYLHMRAPVNPELSLQKFKGRLKTRQADNNRRLFEIMGIKRGDDSALNEWRERGYRYFDAPVAIILASDRVVSSKYAHFIIGSLSQSISLAAMNFGLGTCIHGQGVTYPEAIRKWVPIPKSQRIIEAVSLGYPDPDFPANTLVSARDPLDKVVQWVGF